jgi:hypothetical protein
MAGSEENLNELLTMAAKMAAMGEDAARADKEMLRKVRAKLQEGVRMMESILGDDESDEGFTQLYRAATATLKRFDEILKPN